MRNVIVFALVAIAGCHGTPVASPPPPPVDPCQSGANLCVRPSTIKNKVDVLFVLDDSPTMGPALAAWRASLPRLAAALIDLADGRQPVSYHLGAITADVGAGPATLAALGCHPGGDNGRLHTGTLALAGGVRFIDENQLSRTQNYPGNDLAAALDAIADVGTSGCEFPSPLEAAHRALNDPVPENIGFLRSDALLVVIFVTDGDDCSAPPTTDLFDSSITAYGPLDRFRCTQFGIACGGSPVPPANVSGLTACTSQTMADGGKLVDVDRYINFFTQPAARGGVKIDPKDVILVGVAGPADPVGVTVTSPCPADASASSCPQLNHSCESTIDTGLIGDPAVRLSAVIAAVQSNVLTSVCDTSDDDTVADLRGTLLPRVSTGCLDAAVALRSDGTPDCLVEDVTANADGTTTVTEIPSCAENGHVTPCWQLVDRLAQYEAQQCTPPGTPPPSTCQLPASCQPVSGADGQLQLYTALVDRGVDASGAPNPPPPATGTRFDCATIVKQ